MSMSAVSPSACWEDPSGPTQVPSLAAALLPAEPPHSKQRGSPDRSPPGPHAEVNSTVAVLKGMTGSPSAWLDLTLLSPLGRVLGNAHAPINQPA